MNRVLQMLARKILSSVTGELRESLVGFAKGFKERAKKTPNPWDDILAELICSILEVE